MCYNLQFTTDNLQIIVFKFLIKNLTIVNCQLSVVNKKIMIFKHTIKEYGITVNNNEISFNNGVSFKSASLASHLKDCFKCYCLAATLGHGIDSEINKLQITSVAEALELDKQANKLIEQKLNDLLHELEFNEKQYGNFVTQRFSVGYGDFDIKYQQTMLDLTNAAKIIGLTLTNSNLLLPQKSVTAIIGVRKIFLPHKCKCDDCGFKSSCNKQNEK